MSNPVWWGVLAVWGFSSAGGVEVVVGRVVMVGYVVVTLYVAVFRVRGVPPPLEVDAFSFWFQFDWRWLVGLLSPKKKSKILKNSCETLV